MKEYYELKQIVHEDADKKTIVIDIVLISENGRVRILTRNFVYRNDNQSDKAKIFWKYAIQRLSETDLDDEKFWYNSIAEAIENM